MLSKEVIPLKREHRKIISLCRFSGRCLKIILPVLILFISLFTGCAEEDTLQMPLRKGVAHIYTGTYTSKAGIGKAITLAAGEHHLNVEREYEAEDGKRFLLTFNRGDDRLIGMILIQQEDGLYAVFGKNVKNLLIPKNVKSGQTWKSKFASKTITTRIGGRKTFDTGLGKLEGREVSFKSEDGNRVKLWLNDTHGVIAIHYSYIIQAANRTEADLILKKVETPEIPASDSLKL